jgi:replicative DNA helicase
LESLTKDDFFLESHRIIYQKMSALSERGQGIDFITVFEELSKDGLLDQVGGASFVSSLTDGVPIQSDSNLDEYCAIVKEKSTLRRILNTANNIMSRCLDATEDSQAVIEAAYEQISDIGVGKGLSRARSMAEIVGSSSALFERIFEGKKVEGVPTGLDDLDEITNGIQYGDLTIIAARPSVGKTALGIQVAARAAAAGIKTGIFSLEMTAQALMLRLVSSVGSIDSWKLRSGLTGKADAAMTSQAIARIAMLPIYIEDTSTLNASQLHARVKRLKSQYEIRCLIVDYLQLLDSGRRQESRQVEVSQISRSLKRIAQTENIAVIALSQLSRDPEKGGRPRRPRLSDLRESGAIEQDADCVIFIHASPNGHELIIGKQRNGPVGIVPITFLKQYTRFETQAREEE